MTMLIDFTAIDNYSHVYVSRTQIKIIKKQGLIEPLVVVKNKTTNKYKIHPRQQSLYQAFKTVAESYGNEGAKNIIAVNWDDLSWDEKKDM